MTTQGARSLVHQGYKYMLYRITAPVFANQEEFFQCFQDTWIDGNFPVCMWNARELVKAYSHWVSFSCTVLYCNHY